MDLQGNTRLSPTIATWPIPSYGVIRSLRFLLVFIVLSCQCISLVQASVDELPDNVRQKLSSNPHLQERQNIIRRYRLVARCSNKQVRLRFGRQIRATGRRRHKDSVLRVESFDLDGNVRIQSERYKRFICFDRRDKLTIMDKGDHEGCQFKEILTADGYTQFKSLRKGRNGSDLFIGFRHNGKPIKGWERRRKGKCYQFLKKTVEPEARPPRIEIPIRRRPVNT